MTVAGETSDERYERVPWPAIGHQRRDWQWPRHGPRPPRADRSFTEFDAALPADIAGRPVVPGPEAAAALAAAAEAVRVLDRTTTVDLTALAGALLRSESVASSRIEHLRAGHRDLGLALLRRPGARRGVAGQVAANVRAMRAAIALGDPNATNGPDGPDGPEEPDDSAARDRHDTHDLTVDDVLSVHRTLLQDDPEHAPWAGRLRTVQNWVGGSFHSPRDALFVPPPPGLVAPLMTDLTAFCRRTDVDPVAQAAVAHAQFETIHPFTDGNGRTGRALVHLVWRRRRLTTRAVVPVSTVLLADTRAYFAGLQDYRSGALDPWLARFAAATSHAASVGLRLAQDLADLRAQWLDAARPRRGSAVGTILEALISQPVIDVDAAREVAAGVADKNLYRALDRLVAAEILAEVSGGARNRVWVAVDVVDLLDRFDDDLGRRR